MKKTIASIVGAVAIVLSVTGCYKTGEILEVEIEQGKHGEFKELEVARSEGMNPDTYETDVPADSSCDQGDLVQDCAPEK
jgi:hypothetical protein